jgi:hypothetical protein
MLIASFYMLGPILGRAMGHSFLDNLLVSDLSWDITITAIWCSFFISLLLYDRTVIKKIHPVTLAGSGYFVLVCVLAWIL